MVEEHPTAATLVVGLAKQLQTWLGGLWGWVGRRMLRELVVLLIFFLQAHLPCSMAWQGREGRSG